MWLCVYRDEMTAVSHKSRQTVAAASVILHSVFVITNYSGNKTLQSQLLKVLISRR